MSALQLSVLALWLVVAVLVIVVLGVVRRALGVLDGLERSQLGSPIGLGGVAVGTKPAPFTAWTRDGAPLTDVHLRGASRVVVFVSTSCEPCRALLVDLLEPEAAWADPPSLLFVLEDSAESRELSIPPLAKVAFQRAGAVATAFSSGGTPHAFVLDASGVVRASGVPNRLSDLRALVARADEARLVRDASPAFDASDLVVGKGAQNGHRKE